MNVLFLDIDGVLNNAKWDEMIYRTRRAQMNKEYEQTKDINKLRWEYDIDPANVTQLKRIMEKVPSLNLVISSTWRLHYTVEEFQERFSNLLGVDKSRIIGKTPRLFEHRGVEIQSWLDDHVVERLAIVDDDSDMDHLMPMLFQTSGDNGLDKSVADKIIGHFSV